MLPEPAPCAAPWLRESGPGVPAREVVEPGSTAPPQAIATKEEKAAKSERIGLHLVMVYADQFGGYRTFCHGARRCGKIRLAGSTNGSLGQTSRKCRSGGTHYLVGSTTEPMKRIVLVGRSRIATKNGRLTARLTSTEFPLVSDPTMAVAPAASVPTSVTSRNAW
jgi:hypothetical protein